MAIETANRRNNNKKHPFIRLKRRLRYYYLRIVRINDPPERIARGFAIGVLMGILPTFGLGIILSFAFAFVLKANKAAAILGSFIMNPITSPLFWTLSAVIGSLILGEDYRSILEKVKDEGLLNGIGWAYIVFMTGNIIVASGFTVAAYYGIRRIIIRHREKKALKEERRKEGHFK